jgi:hypothetical protein
MSMKERMPKDQLMRFVGAVACIALTGPVALGDNPNEPSAGRAPVSNGAFGAASVRTVLDGVWAGRQDLHSGVCRAVWELSMPTYHEQQRYSIWFDYDQELKRIDRASLDGNVFVHRVDRPTEKILYVNDTLLATRKAPDPGDRSGGVRNGGPFDARSVGLLTLQEALVGKMMRGGFRTDHSTGPPTTARDGKLLRIDWDHGNMVAHEGGSHFERYRRLFWIDPEKSFAPVRLESWRAIGDTSEAPLKLGSTTVTEWARVRDVWVPRHCHLESKQPAERAADLTFEWLSVNEPVDESTFTVSGLGLPDGTAVQDCRLGTPIVEYVVGRQRATVIHAPASPFWRWFAVVASVATLGAYGAFLIYRSFRSPRRIP